VDAQYNIGLIYENGEFVPVSNMNALKWYKAAANAGKVEAMDRLGKVYESGQLGEKRNLKLAQHWYDKANQFRVAH
jgi:hypothetical protein